MRGVVKRVVEIVDMGWDKELGSVVVWVGLVGVGIEE